MGLEDDGALALSVNFWWWPIHNDKAMEQWSYQNECESFRNARIPVSKPLPERAAHALSFYQLTMKQRQEAAVPKPWPTGVDHGSSKEERHPADGYRSKVEVDPSMNFELVD